MSDLLRPTGTASINATTTTARVATSGAGLTARIANGGSVPVFIEFGGPSVNATVATSMMILPGTCEIFETPVNSSYFAAITESGTARVSLTRCDGDV